MKKGVLFAGAAYAIWGFFPIYFHAIKDAPAFQIVAHRVFWSFLFVSGLILFRKEFKNLRSVITGRALLIYLAAAVLLAINWLVYVWAVNAGFVIETSLGYFINPLVSVMCGVLILREKLRPFQWIPIGLAAVAVIYMTVSLGTLPWIALALAFSFGLYGLVKKISPLNALYGLTVETALLFIPATIFLIYSEVNGAGSFGHASWSTSLLLALTGVVTAIPLLMFATGARLVTLTTIGLLQYFAPTIQFIIGVFLFGEALNPTMLIGFIITWTALILFTLEGFYARHQQAKRIAAAEATDPVSA